MLFIQLYSFTLLAFIFSKYVSTYDLKWNNKEKNYEYI